MCIRDRHSDWRYIRTRRHHWLEWKQLVSTGRRRYAEEQRGILDTQTAVEVNRVSTSVSEKIKKFLFFSLFSFFLKREIKGTGVRNRGMWKRIGILSVVVLFCTCVVAAQPNIVELRDLIKISVEPASIPADGVSTSRIEIAVFSPERLGGGPAAHTEVEISTDLGTLRDAENESNSGSEITLFTNDTAIAVALLSADEPG